MKVALIDNMNNNFFALTRYFRDRGIEADLFLIPDSRHFQFAPDQDTWVDLSNTTWIKYFPVSYHWTSYFKPISSFLRKKFLKYDKIIACGPAMGLLNRAGITIDLFVPYGDDLFNRPFLSKYKLSRKIIKILPSLFVSFYCAFLQKKSIQSAKTIISNTNWRVAQDAIDCLGCKSLNLPRIMVYKEDIPDQAFAEFAWLRGHDFVVFSPTRHLWKTNADPLSDFDSYGGTKRNDKLIFAFSRVVKEKLFEKPILVFCEYGNDVAHSIALIKNLGIQNYVRWLPLMPRKKIVAGMSLATFVADQFREGMSATSSGTTNEALAFGTPVITNTNGAIQDKNDPYYNAPILDALKEDDIYNHFKKYSTDIDFYKQIGDKSKIWFENNLGLSLAKKYINILKLT